MAESGQQVSGKKRPRAFFQRAKDGKRLHKNTMLTVGMKGFLLTCNHGVKPCIKEAYNILSEYGDEMYGQEKDEQDEEKGSGSEEDEEDECDDIEASLQKEIAGMKKQRKARQQRFQAVESGAKNVAFIKSKVDNASDLVHHILTDVQESKKNKSRHIMRMLPVTATCRSYLEDIEKQSPLVLKPIFEREDGKVFTFCIMYKARNCGHLKREEVITTLHRLVTDMGRHTVDLNHAEKVIMVEVIRNVCCLSVLTDFFKLRKYNMQAITGEFNEDNTNRGRKRKFQKTEGGSEAQATEKNDEESVENKEKSSKVESTSDGSNEDKDSASHKADSVAADVDVTASEAKSKTVDADAETGSVTQTNVSSTSDDNAATNE